MQERVLRYVIGQNDKLVLLYHKIQTIYTTQKDAKVVDWCLHVVCVSVPWERGETGHVVNETNPGMRLAETCWSKFTSIIMMY